MGRRIGIDSIGQLGSAAVVGGLGSCLILGEVGEVMRWDLGMGGPCLFRAARLRASFSSLDTGSKVSHDLLLLSFSFSFFSKQLLIKI